MIATRHGARVLLLMTTATYRASAFLDAARRLPVAVTVGSDRPQVLAAADPGGHLTLDFLALERSVRAVRDFAREHPIRAVIAADDDGVVLGAMAAAALGLRHNPVAAVAAARDKARMREVLRDAGIPGPHFRCLSAGTDPAVAARTLDYPCVVKPASLSASRGVIRADDPEGFVRAFRRVAAIMTSAGATARGGFGPREILVESYLPGVEVALEGLLTAGRLRTLAVFDKPDRLEGPFFEETIYVTPSRLAPEVQRAVVACAGRVAAALGLTDGPVHAEFRVDRRGPWVLEIAPRSIGGLCSRSLHFGRGVSLEELILRHALGEDVDSLEREERAAGVMMIPIPRAGILRRAAGRDEAVRVPGVEDVRLTIPVGHEVAPPPEGARYLGFIFARGGAPEDVEAALREAHGRMRFEIVPAD